MKLLVALVVCLSIASVWALTTDEIKDKMRSAHKKCQEDPKTALDEEALKAYKTSHGKGPKPANYEAHSLCLSKVLGWQNDDGTVNKNNIKEFIGHEMDEAKFNEVMSKCVDEGKDAAGKAVDLFNCFFTSGHEHKH